MKVRGRLGLALAAAFTLATLLALPLPASAAGQTTTTEVAPSPLDEPIGSDTVVNAWAVAPAGPATNPTAPSERPYLAYDVVPGQVIHDAVTLYNYSNVPLSFRLLPTDAFNNAEGAFDVPPTGAKPKEVGTWVKLDQENLSLPPKSQATVPLTLTIPRRVSPGDHAGAVIASSATVGTGPDGKTVNVDRRTGTRLYIRVAGALNPELAITAITNTYRPSLNPFGGRLDVTFRVENDGNVRLGGKQNVSVNALLGIAKRSMKTTSIPELLPGQGVTLSASFSGMPATALSFAKVYVTPDAAAGTSANAVTRTATTVSIPWTIVAVGLIAYLVRRAWRAYRAHQPEAAVPACP